MPVLESCISANFEPGNIPASVGEPPVRVVIGTFEDPEDYDPEAVDYSLNYSRFFNSPYLLLLMV